MCNYRFLLRMKRYVEQHERKMTKLTKLNFIAFSNRIYPFCMRGTAKCVFLPMRIAKGFFMSFLLSRAIDKVHESIQTFRWGDKSSRFPLDISFFLSLFLFLFLFLSFSVFDACWSFPVSRSWSIGSPMIRSSLRMQTAPWGQTRASRCDGTWLFVLQRFYFGNLVTYTCATLFVVKIWDLFFSH